MTILEIKEYIEKYFNTDLSLRNRQLDCLKYRYLYCYIAYYYSTEFTSYQKIGDAINRNHATVINAVRQFPNLLEAYPRFKKEVDDFKKTLPLERFDKDLKYQEYDKMKLLAKLNKKDKEILEYRREINNLKTQIRRLIKSKNRYRGKLYYTTKKLEQ